MKQIIIYADGACRGNQNQFNLGAYAYCLSCEDKTKSFAKAVPNTTNNRMELQSVISALQALKPISYDYEIILYSDSQYVVSGYNQWISGWIAKNWAGVKNPDLWQELLEETRKFSNLTFKKVAGHADCEGNIKVDKLCNSMMDWHMSTHEDIK